MPESSGPRGSWNVGEFRRGGGTSGNAGRRGDGDVGEFRMSGRSGRRKAGDRRGAGDVGEMGT